jgi:hypothetical protein
MRDGKRSVLATIERPGSLQRPVARLGHRRALWETGIGPD